MLYQSLIIVFLIVLFGWLYNKFWINRRFSISDKTLHGKTVLITGGNTGIGYETAKQLLKRGARVIIACRNLEKGYQAIENLRFQSKCHFDKIKLMECDLSSLESVRKFCKFYCDNEDRLDILLCNAGLGYSINKLTNDHFDTLVQTNYIGHFLVTHLLLDKLRKCKPSRIINVSSDLHQSIKSIDWSDAFTQLNNKDLMGTYPISKLFQILSTYQFKKILFDEDIDVFALTPGLVSTSINDPLEKSIGYLTSFIYYPFMYFVKFLFSRTVENGAQTLVYCSLQPNLTKSNEIYFRNCRASKSSSLSIDPQTAQQLWNITNHALNIQ